MRFKLYPIMEGEYRFSQGFDRELSITCGKNTLMIFKPGDHFTVKGITDSCQRIWMHISGKMMNEIAKDLNIYDTHIIKFSESETLSILHKFSALRTAVF